MIDFRRSSNLQHGRTHPQPNNKDSQPLREKIYGRLYQNTNTFNDLYVTR